MHDARLPDGDVELLEEELEKGEDARGEAEPLLSKNSSAVMNTITFHSQVRSNPSSSSERASASPPCRSPRSGDGRSGASRSSRRPATRPPRHDRHVTTATSHDSHVTTASEVASVPCTRQCSGVPLRDAPS